jgi:histidyl-tRNA synthetase
MKAQMKLANRSGASFAVIVGEQECVQFFPRRHGRLKAAVSVFGLSPEFEPLSRSCS